MATPAQQSPMDARAVLERVDDVLIVRTREQDPHPGVWTFPGGPVESGDSPEITVRRCAREQLGVQVEIFVGQPPFEFDVDGRKVVFRYYMCGILGGEPHAKYWPECKWVHKTRLGEFDFEPKAQQVADWLMKDVE